MILAQSSGYAAYRFRVDRAKAARGSAAVAARRCEGFTETSSGPVAKARPRYIWPSALLCAAFLAAQSGTIGATAASRAQVGTAPAASEDVARLVQELQDPDPQVRARAASKLGQLRDPRGLPPLIRAMKDSDAKVRESATLAACVIGHPDAVDPLIAVLSDPAERVRVCGAVALGLVGDRRAVDGLSETLGDSRPEVRAAAATALGRVADTRALGPLVDALEDEDPRVRRSAAISLGQFRDRRAAPPLISALRDSEPGVRAAAAFALGQHRDPAATRALADVARRDAMSHVRAIATAALGEDRDPVVRSNAALALGLVARRDALDTLVDDLRRGHRPLDYQEIARRSARGAGDRGVTGALVTALSDPSAAVRASAARALGIVGRADANSALERLAREDTDLSVRTEALAALDRIRTTARSRP